MNIVAFSVLRAFLIFHLSVGIVSGCGLPRLIGTAYAQDVAAAIDAANQQVVQLLHAGKFAEARALAAKTLKQALDSIGPRHPLAILAIGNYASASNELGDHEEALRFLELGLKISREVRGEKHPQTVVAMSNYASVLLAQGRAADALPLFERAHAYAIELHGEKDANTLTLLNNYAMALRDLGRTADAAPHLERSYKLHSEIFGPKHMMTLIALHNYALIADALGQSREALPLFEQSLRLRTEVLGEKHPNTLRALSAYATSLKKVGRVVEALPHHERAFNLQRELLGAKHPLTLGALSSYASALYTLGRVADALPLYERVLRLRGEVLGEKHPDALAAFHDYANSLAEVGRREEALTHLRRGLDLTVEALGEKHPKSLTALSSYAVLQWQVSRSADALSLLDRALKLRVEVQGEQHPATLEALNSLAVALIGAGRHAEALPHFQRAMSLTSEALGDVHPGSLTMQYNYAAALMALGRAHEALPYLEKFMSGAEAQREEAGRDSVETQRAQFGLTLRGYHAYLIALNRSGRTQDALGMLERTKARTLLEQMALRSAAGDSGLPETDARTLLDYGKRIGEMDTRIAQATNSGEREPLKAQRNAASRGLAELKLRLQKTYPRFQQITNVRLATADDAKQLLPPGSVFVSYAFMEGDLLRALSTDATGTVTYHDLATMPGITDTIEALRMWSANLGEGAMVDDTGRTIQIMRWTDGDKPGWRVVTEGRACTAQQLRQDEPRSEFAALGADIPSLGAAPTTPGGNAGADCIPPGALFVSGDAQYQELVDYLGKALIAPLRAQLAGKTQIIISPDGPLGLLAFDILPFDGKPLIAQFEVSQVQSLSVLKLLKERQAEYGRNTARDVLLAIGNPDYGGDGAAPNRGAGRMMRSPMRSGTHPMEMLRTVKWAALPGTQTEMDQAARIFPGKSRVISGKAASETTLRALSANGELASYRYLHFAAHGYFDPSFPAYSSLVLAAEGVEPERDGYVTIGEWVGMNLKSELTLLSACNTARGENVSGEGLMGLSYALYVAGNINTLLTLWPVADEETAEFVSKLFVKIKAGQTHAQAITAVKREFMHHADPRKRNPYFWAPFVLYGI